MSLRARIAMRFVSALALAVFALAATIEAFSAGYPTPYMMKVNPLTRPGKSANSVNHDEGVLKLNILDNRYFHNREPDEHVIFVSGTSATVVFPDVAFKYKEKKYHIYNFSIAGNGLMAALKIFSITSAFHPDFVIVPLTPAQLVQPVYQDGAFPKECLGTLNQYHWLDALFQGEDDCNPVAPARRPFSWKRTLENVGDLLLYAFQSGSGDDRFDKNFISLRTTLSSVGQDLLNSTLVLFGASSTAKVQASRGLPVLDLGTIDAEKIAQGRMEIAETLARYPDALTPNPQHASDAEYKWWTTRPLRLLERDGDLMRVFSGMADLAKRSHSKIIFYNHPVAHESPGMFTDGYYEKMRALLKDSLTNAKIPFLDEGDIAIRKGTLWGDTYHLNAIGIVAVSKSLVFDAIEAGYFDD